MVLLELLVQALDLDPQVGAQLGVEVGQRLVEQEHVHVAHQRAADGDALALAAGQGAGLALQQRLDLQDLGGAGDALLDLGLGHAARSCRPKDRFPSTVICG